MTTPHQPKDALFVNSEIQIFEGDEARRRLADKNDARFLDGPRGVVRVDRERWAEAQRYERRTWMENERFSMDDHNRSYLGSFQGYEVLRGREFQRGIELGCGPFTNMRLILERTRVREVHLLDPLAADYQAHPFCRYRGGRIGGLRALASRTALASWRSPRRLAEEFLNAIRIGGLLGLPVHLEAAAIEEFQPSGSFDLVVMINVLEHCRDAEVIFRKIEEILSPGGVFVFRDRLWDEPELRRTIETLYDAGHPLRVGRSAAEPFLARFEPLLRVEEPVLDIEEGIRLERTVVSLIGRRRI